MSMLSWSLAHLAQGIFPSARHDGKDWTESDDARKIHGGEQLGFRAMCLFIKGDWMEFVTSLGFTSWQSGKHPCLFCKCTQADMYDLRGFSPMGLASPARTMVDYMRSCVQCETRVALTPAHIRQIRPCMYFDKRRTADGNHGRSLSRDVPELGLLRNSRLEPSSAFPDIHNFDADDMGAGPLSGGGARKNLVFGAEIFFCAESGVSIDSIAIDWLHTLSLGVFQHLLDAFVWDLVAADAFQVRQSTKQARLELSVAQIRSQLFDWYRTESLEDREHSKVQSLVASMLGTDSRPDLKLHGAETNGFLRFAATHLVPKYASTTANGPAWANLINGALEILDLIHDTRGCRKMAGHHIQRFVVVTSAHIKAFQQIGQRCRPKHHFWMEMAARLPSTEAQLA